jgi:hypothetical protein
VFFFKRLFPVILVSALLIGACGPLPKPFKPDVNGGAPSPFEQLGDIPGIVVAPVENTPPGVGGPIADSIAESLRRANTPATTAGALLDGYLLEGRARTITWGARHSIVIDWTLTDRRGAILDQRSTNVVTDIPVQANTPVQNRPDEWSLWRHVGEADLKTTSQTIASALAALLQRNIPVQQARPRPLLGVASVTGASGDGNESLRRAFEAVLRRTGLPVAATPDAATVRIHGVVKLTDLEGGQKKLDITWTFRRPDGAEIGVMTQHNAVQDGQVKTRWGPLAYDITLAAIDGVVNILRKMDAYDAITRP